MALGSIGERTPGISIPEATSVTNAFWWGQQGIDYDWVGETIDDSVTDTGNPGNTTMIRPGFLLGKNVTDKKLYKWDPTATDGTQYIFGILYGGINMLNYAGTATNKVSARVVTWGKVKASNLLIPGNTSVSIVGDAYEYVVRTQMAKRFQFADEHNINQCPLLSTGLWVAKTADYTVLASDHGQRFSTLGASGAVIFTLPATATAGLRYEFCNMADQNMTITSGTADSIITDGDLAADSVAYSTASHKIGGRCIVEGLGGATTGKWLLTTISDASPGTVTS